MGGGCTARWVYEMSAPTSRSLHDRIATTYCYQDRSPGTLRCFAWSCLPKISGLRCPDTTPCSNKVYYNILFSLLSADSFEFVFMRFEFFNQIVEVAINSLTTAVGGRDVRPRNRLHCTIDNNRLEWYNNPVTIFNEATRATIS